MTIFEAIKSTVTPRMAAEHFGLVSPQWMVIMLKSKPR